MAVTLDASVFDPATWPADAAPLNEQLIAVMSSFDQWAVQPAAIRAARKAGRGAFPVQPKSARVVEETVVGPHGNINLRIIAPEKPKAVYLHIHGGGWTLGSHDQMDPYFEHLADDLGIACIDVDYRLAPEDPYPAGPDDCEAAALWLVKHGKARFGTETFFIGGESAGAHLSVVTLVRLRDKHGITPFAGAQLHAGCYDLALTPSARAFQPKLVLNHRDIEMFARHFVLRGGDLRHPDISPIHADLRGLPPAIFTVGSMDPVFDDSLLMASHWMAAGNKADFTAYPGGCHVFIAFPGTVNAEKCLAQIDGFFAGLIA